VKITTAYEKTVSHPACRVSWLAIVIRKKITRQFRRGVRRTGDKIRVKRRSVGPGGREGKGKRREGEGEREGGGSGWRRGEEIHYHKAGNFTRIMSELRIPRDSPRCCLSLSEFRHNGHTSTTQHRAFSPPTLRPGAELRGSSSERPPAPPSAPAAAATVSKRRFNLSLSEN
jgi:hypothetical protein